MTIIFTFFLEDPIVNRIHFSEKPYLKKETSPHVRADTVSGSVPLFICGSSDNAVNISQTTARKFRVKCE
jgi:hypothetical protein